VRSFRAFPTAAALATAISLTGLIACSAAGPPAAETAGSKATAHVAPATVAAAPTDDAVHQILAISVDGLNPVAIRQLGAAGAPAFHRLMREGAYTLNARTEYEKTETLPNHTGMLTGRRVEAATGGHGIDFNSDTGTTVHQQAGRYVASVFDVVHDHGGRTALYSAKTKFELYDRTWNAHGRHDTIGKDHGTRKIDRVALNTNNAGLVQALNAELKSAPRTFTLLHISPPDTAGHQYGFMSANYLAAVRETDRLLGTVLDTVAGKPSLKDHTLVLLTADHGGGDAFGHSDPRKLQNYRVPFMAWGPGVAKGKDLYAINSAFEAPGTSRPSYGGRQPIRNGDIANLTTDVLNLPTVPGSELDRPRRLNVFAR
jgi:predicted AlkP superfamily pyrophosphatase or phosphodiesterase